MYRLQVKCSGKWCWGIKKYDSKEDADARVAELAKVGIKARVKTEKEFLY